MKRRFLPVLMALFCAVTSPGAFAQNLPGSMARPVSAGIHLAAHGQGQQLLVTGNTLVVSANAGIDLGIIPSDPESAVPSSLSSPAAAGIQDHLHQVAPQADSTTGTARFAALLGGLSIIWLGRRKLSQPCPEGDISELRNFPKNRLAHHVAGA